MGDDEGMVALPTWLDPEVGGKTFERERLEGRVHMKVAASVSTHGGHPADEATCTEDEVWWVGKSGR